MNILFLTYQGDIAGSTNSIIYLTRGLADRGHGIYVGCREESLLYKTLRNTHVHLIPMTFRSKFDQSNIKQIREVVYRYNIQIINAQSSKDRYTSIFARWLYRLPVSVVHTRRQVSQSVGGLQSWLYCKGTDKIIAVSKGVKESLTKKGIPDHHIKVIYNGTPKEKYNHLNSAITEDLRRKFSIKSHDFVIGCVSRIKNQEQLLEALKYIDFKVKVIFAGIEKPDYHDEITREYTVDHDIYYEGMVACDMILNYYPLFDLKVLPSTMEGLSQSVLEAMYLKVPVIATRAAGNVDLVQHNHNGLLFDNADIKCLKTQIEAVYHDHVDCQALTGNAYTTASSDFCIGNTINTYESFFRGLLAKKLVPIPAFPVFSD